MKLTYHLALNSRLTNQEYLPETALSRIRVSSTGRVIFHAYAGIYKLCLYRMHNKLFQDYYAFDRNPPLITGQQLY